MLPPHGSCPSVVQTKTIGAEVTMEILRFLRCTAEALNTAYSVVRSKWAGRVGSIVTGNRGCTATWKLWKLVLLLPGLRSFAGLVTCLSGQQAIYSAVGFIPTTIHSYTSPAPLPLAGPETTVAQEDGIGNI